MQFRKSILICCASWLLSFTSFAQSKTIDYYMKTAQINSPLIADIQTQILSNNIDSLKLVANYGYIVSGEGSALYAPSYNGFGYDQAITNGQSIIAGLRISKEFITANNYNTRLRTFGLIQAQLESKKAVSLLSLKRQIADQYVATWSSQELLRIDREIFRLLSQEDIVLKKLTTASVFRQTDYLAFKVRQQQTSLAMQQREAELTGNLALLNYLSGSDDSLTYSLERPSYTEDATLAFDRSAYYGLFAADSSKLANDAALIDYDYRSKIVGFTDAGFQSSLQRQPYKNYGVSVGVNISLPLFDGHKKQLLLKQNDLAKNTANNYYTRQQKQYATQQSQLQIQIKKYNEIMRTAKLQLTYASTLVEANAKQLPTGDVKMVDYILAINNLLDLRSSIIQTETILFTLRNQLQYIILQ